MRMKMFIFFCFTFYVGFEKWKDGENPWIWICIYFDPKCSMNWCDTAIESLRCKLKSFGYHYGTQRAVRSHEWESCKHLRHVYITIKMNVLSILGTMIVPKNIFAWKSDIQAFRIWIRNYSIYSGSLDEF